MAEIDSKNWLNVFILTQQIKKTWENSKRLSFPRKARVYVASRLPSTNWWRYYHAVIQTYHGSEDIQCCDWLLFPVKWFVNWELCIYENYDSCWQISVKLGTSTQWFNMVMGAWRICTVMPVRVGSHIGKPTPLAFQSAKTQNIVHFSFLSLNGIKKEGPYSPSV